MGPGHRACCKEPGDRKILPHRDCRPRGVRVSDLREAAVTLMLSLNLISTLAEAEPRYPITECRSSLMVSRRCGLGWAIGRATHPARVSPRARISGGRPFALGRSFPLVGVTAPRL